MTDLRSLIALVEAEWVAMDVGGFRFGVSYEEWRDRRRAAIAKSHASLTAAGAGIGSTSSGDAWIRLAGIRSVSTQGLPQACANWLAAARKQLAKKEEANG